VTYAEFNVGAGKRIHRAYQADPEDGQLMALVVSLRYADTSEPVFKTLEEVLALPYRFRERLSYLASQCMKANGEDEILEQLNGPTNGSGATADPSH
jgi:hypothetical protein